MEVERGLQERPNMKHVSRCRSARLRQPSHEPVVSMSESVQAGTTLNLNF